MKGAESLQQQIQQVSLAYPLIDGGYEASTLLMQTRGGGESSMGHCEISKEISLLLPAQERQKMRVTTKVMTLGNLKQAIHDEGGRT